MMVENPSQKKLLKGWLHVPLPWQQGIDSHHITGSGWFKLVLLVYALSLVPFLFHFRSIFQLFSSVIYLLVTVLS